MCEDVVVLDNVTAENVTVQTLGQVITEEGRKGRTLFRSDLGPDGAVYSKIYSAKLSEDQ